MKITLNGTLLETDACTVSELIASTPMAGKPVVVELNQHALVASAHATTKLQEADQIEVLVLGAGG